MLSLILVLLVPAASSTEWLQYGGPARDFVATASSPTQQHADSFTVKWKQPCGPGTSCLLTDGRYCYSFSVRLKAGSKTEGEEVVAAHELATGAVRWEKAYAISRLKGQESFSGDPIRPQATPALHRGTLCTLGYTGILTGWDASTGQQRWRIDLVTELGAKPVQFGFAASPLIYEDSFMVHVGGSQAVVIRLDAVTGKVIWKTEPGEPSYASPVLVTMDNTKHLVQVTRDAILGFDPATGKTLWKYALPEAGLTNVPTPLAVPGNKLLVSGQGIKGTHLLQFTRRDDTWAITELWYNSKVTFFYCNWQMVGEAVYGNANKILLGLSLVDGKELWRERGYAEANLLQLGGQHYLLDGDGQLTRCTLLPTGLVKQVAQKVLSSRCWTTPTPAGDVLLVRNQEEMAAVQWGR